MNEISGKDHLEMYAINLIFEKLIAISILLFLILWQQSISSKYEAKLSIQREKKVALQIHVWL